MRLSLSKLVGNLDLTVMSSFQIALYVIKCLIRAWNIKYNSIHCAANLLAGVVQYHVSSAWPFKETVYKRVFL